MTMALVYTKNIGFQHIFFFFSLKRSVIGNVPTVLLKM